MVDARGMRGGGESLVVEFGILGPVQAVRDGRELALGGPRPRAVLALLLVAAGRGGPGGRVVGGVWGGGGGPGGGGARGGGVWGRGARGGAGGGRGGPAA